LFEVGYPSLIEVEKYFASFQPARQEFLDRHFYYSDEEPVTLIPFDYNALLGNKYFFGMIRSVKVHRNVIKAHIVGKNERTQKVLNLIEEELKKL